MSRGNESSTVLQSNAVTAQSHRTGSIAIPERPIILENLQTNRQQELDRLRKILLHSDARICVLHGFAGSGKTRLAQGLFFDPQIQLAFPGGTHWIDVGPQPGDLLEQLNRVGAALSENWEHTESLQETETLLSTLLANTSALLIFDDVCTVQHALQLQLARTQSKLLFTTRSELIADALQAPHITLQRLPHESMHRLWQEASARYEQKHINKTRHAYKQVANNLAGNPQALAMFSYLLFEGLPIDQRAFAGFARALPPLSSVLAYWLDTQSRITQQLVLALGIFPERTPIPQHTVASFWAALSPELENDFTQDLLRQLQAFDLVHTRLHSGDLTISDTIKSYSIQQADEQHSDWHRQLLHLYNPHGRAWHEIKNDGYLYSYLGYHLLETGEIEQLHTLLLDFEWMTARLDATGPAGLQEDFQIVQENKTLRMVEEAIRLASPILRQDPKQLASQLIGRLQDLDIPFLRELVTSIRLAEKAEPVWLDPFRVHLQMPGSALLRSFAGHKGPILAVDVDVESKCTVSASDDHTLRIWDLKTGVCKKILTGHQGEVHLCRVFNSQVVVSCSEDNTQRVWDLASGDLISTYRLHEAKVLALAPHPNGRYMVSGDESGKLLVWVASTGEIVNEIKQENGAIWSVAISRDGLHGVTAGDNAVIRVWDLETGSCRQTLIGHSDWVWSVVLTPDGRHLLSASEDQTIILWSLEEGRAIKVLKRHQAGVRNLALSEDGQLLVSSADDQSMVVWHPIQGKVLRAFTGLEDWVWDMAITPDGDALLSASDDASLKLWSLTGQSYKHQLDAHEKGVRCLAIAPENTTLITGSDDTTLKRWRINSGLLESTLNGHDDWVWDVLMTSDGNHLVSASFDHTLSVWDLKSGNRTQILKGHDDWVWCAAMSWNNRHLISGSEDQTVRIWDFQSGRLENILQGHKGGITSLVVSDDNRYVISASTDHTIRVWKIQDGTPIHSLKGHTGPVRSLLMSVIDQRIISSADDGTIRLWNFTMGYESQCLAGHEGPVRHIALTPMGMHLISAGEDRTVRLWDLTSGEMLFSLYGHEKDIRALDVSRDGRWAVTAGDDHAMFLWDLEQSKRIGSFYADHPITCCAFTIDGYRIVAGDAGGGVHFLRVDELG